MSAKREPQTTMYGQPSLQAIYHSLTPTHPRYKPEAGTQCTTHPRRQPHAETCTAGAEPAEIGPQGAKKWAVRL